MNFENDSEKIESANYHSSKAFVDISYVSKSEHGQLGNKRLSSNGDLNNWYCPYGVQTGEGPDTCKPKPRKPTEAEQKRMQEAVDALNKSICPYGVQTGEGPDTCKPKPRKPSEAEQKRMQEAVDALNKSICPYGVQTGPGPDSCKPKPRR